MLAGKIYIQFFPELLFFINLADYMIMMYCYGT